MTKKTIEPQYYKGVDVRTELKITNLELCKLIHDFDDPLPAIRLMNEFRIPIQEFEAWKKRSKEKLFRMKHARKPTPTIPYWKRHLLNA